MDDQEQRELFVSPASIPTYAKLLSFLTKERGLRGKPELYGFALMAAPVPWDVCAASGPMHHTPSEGPPENFVRAFQVITPGGETVPLTQTMLDDLCGVVCRLLGGTLLAYPRVGGLNASSSPDGPITHLEIDLYAVSEKPVNDEEMREDLMLPLLAAECDRARFFTSHRRPEGWPR